MAGLVSARRLEAVLPEASLTLVERESRLGGKILTERVDGLVVEGGPDSFLSRKERGVGLCVEIGLGGELQGRRPEHATTFVRRGGELHRLPAGLTGTIPTDLDALARTTLLSEEGKARVAAEPELPPAPARGDESIAAFVSRRLGREAYEALVEPLMTGIYGGDGEQLSLEATFPALRRLELEHGSLLRGLAEEAPAQGTAHPPFLTLHGGMDVLPAALARSLERTETLTGTRARALRRAGEAYEVVLEGGAALEADAVVLAVPAFAVAELVADLDAELAAEHAAIPYSSSAVVTLAFGPEDQPALDGYGYVVPRAEGSDVLACTWTSNKWEGRAPEGYVLVRVYLGRFGERDVTGLGDDALLAAALEELRLVGVVSEPRLLRIHRWPRGMPQYVLGHVERVARIERALERHPGLALAGAAYRGVGIPDCIRSGEDAAQVVARALAGVAG